MTRNESFKRRVRERMTRTGERYVEARRVLVDQAASRGDRRWVSEPEQTDEVIRGATGRSWDDWVALIEAWSGSEDGHAAVATWLQDQHDVPGWWSQTVTVGWERITGRRLPHQVADGTFTANKSATITVNAGELRTLLLDEDGRDALFPGMDPELRSRPTSKTVRVGLTDGVAEIHMAPKGDGRVTITVAHAKLESSDDVTAWKHFWGEWLTALDEVG